MPLPTLDDLKRHMNMTASGDDDELYDVLDAAVEVVEGIVGPLRGQSVTETHRGVASDVVLLRRRPIASLTSVSLETYSGWNVVGKSLADFVLDADAGLLRLASGYPFRGDVTVTYTAGFASVPAAIRLATLMIGKQMWETQRGSQPLPLQSSDDGAPIESSFYSPGIPPRAQVLLEPYVRGSQVA